MELTGDQVIGKQRKRYMDCMHNCLVPSGYEVDCIACGFNVMKRKK